MTEPTGDRLELVKIREQHPHFDLDLDTANGLITGEIGPDDAPAAYAPVARVITAANAPAQAHELDDEARARAMFVRERGVATPLAAPTHVPLAGSGRRRRSRRASRSAAAVAVAGTLVLTGGMAAAASGILPDPAQRIAHDVLSPIGISVPDVPDSLPSIAPSGREEQNGAGLDGSDQDATSNQPAEPGAGPAASDAAPDADGQAIEPANDELPAGNANGQGNGQATAPGQDTPPGQLESPAPDQPTDPGTSPGNGNGNGNGQTNGEGQNNGSGNANGQANGNGQGNGNGNGNGQANGNGQGNGHANGQANGNAYGQGNGNGQANGQVG